MPLHRTGFTIVELLVIISLVTILLALLAPAVDRAVELAQRTVCASNQDQVGAALGVYAAENTWRLPPNGYDFDAYSYGFYFTGNPAGLNPGPKGDELIELGLLLESRLLDPQGSMYFCPSIAGGFHGNSKGDPAHPNYAPATVQGRRSLPGAWMHARHQYHRRYLGKRMAATVKYADVAGRAYLAELFHGLFHGPDGGRNIWYGDGSSSFVRVAWCDLVPHDPANGMWQQGNPVLWTNDTLVPVWEYADRNR